VAVLFKADDAYEVLKKAGATMVGDIELVDKLVEDVDQQEKNAALVVAVQEGTCARWPSVCWLQALIRIQWLAM
jgi:hypothetical protein